MKRITFAMLAIALSGCGTGLNLAPYKLKKLTGSYTQTDTCPPQTKKFEPDLTAGWNSFRVNSANEAEIGLAFKLGSDTFNAACQVDAKNGKLEGTRKNTEIGTTCTISGTWSDSEAKGTWKFEQHTASGSCATDATGMGDFEFAK